MLRLLSKHNLSLDALEKSGVFDVKMMEWVMSSFLCFIVDSYLTCRSKMNDCRIYWRTLSNEFSTRTIDFGIGIDPKVETQKSTTVRFSVHESKVVQSIFSMSHSRR